MKRFEVLDKGNARHVLTVAPNRITIKFKAGSDAAERKRVLTFLDWVSQTPEMEETDVVYRGRTDLPPDNNTAVLRIQMKTMSGSDKLTYCESDMIADVGELGFEPTMELN